MASLVNWLFLRAYIYIASRNMLSMLLVDGLAILKSTKVKTLGAISESNNETLHYS